MKAITLYQPWAMLIETGWKEVETRDWYTGYRGPLAIHASKRWSNEEKTFWYQVVPGIVGNEQFQKWEEPVLGRVVAICQLVACVPAASVEWKAKQLKERFEPKHSWAVERRVGNYDAGRWAWILREVKPVQPYIVASGQRKLWTVTGETLRSLEAIYLSQMTLPIV